MTDTPVDSIIISPRDIKLIRLTILISGEEFIAVTPDHSSGESRRQADEVLALWQSMAITSEDSPGGDVLSCSIGICQSSAGDFDSLEDMILAADQGLYCAKNMGRARFAVAGSGKRHGQRASDEALFS